MSSKLKYIIIGAVVVLIVSMIIIPRISGPGSNSAEINAQQPQQQQNDRRLAVRAMVLEPQSFDNSIRATGTVLADEDVVLRPEVSGRVTALYFREGDVVSEGDLLVKINDSELQAELRRAEYRRNLAKLREERLASLIERNATAQAEYDVALNELNVIEAEIQLINARIEQTEIRAPFDGIIGLRSVSTGSYITPSSYIAEIQKVNPVKVDFSIPERYSGLVTRNQSFNFRREGSQQEYEGSVYAIQPRIEQDTRTLRLRGIASNEDQLILPGAFVEVQIAMRSVADALLVPSEAIIPEMGGQSVFVYEDGKAQRRQVELGIRTERRVHVTDGLSPGDTLLTTGMLQLRPNMDVRIADFVEN
ncbi:MAG: efflux RND transporter periplasmic adaptor subunit [Balneolia bacterium]|nr:efflux RND transporter periplasmic adaptor subunit [Balneolia bacterium]